MALNVLFAVALACQTSSAQPTPSARPTNLVQALPASAHSSPIDELLVAFDRISARGFVMTQRAGSTGIGYTFESLLNIKENNFPLGDFRGIELKTHRGSDLSSLGSKKMNLFLKEPTWVDGLAHRNRIPTYGYKDDNGRIALYSTVTAKQNSHGLSLRTNRDKARIELLFNGRIVAYWTFEILAHRLQEKLRETVFVGAEARGRGRDEEFHYRTVLYCQEPSIDSLSSLIDSRDVMVEMRMHIREDGSARNHGTAFRVRQDKLDRLFARTIRLRPSQTTTP